MKVDNFAISMFMSCPAKYALRIREHWTSRRKSAALGFGGALHEGLAAWYRTHDRAAALLAINESWPVSVPIDDWRTKEKCLSTMVEYMRTYPDETFQVVGAPESPLVEVTFSHDTGMVMPCACGWECTPPQVRTSDDEPHPQSLPFCPECNAPTEPIEYGGIFDALVEAAGVVYVLEHKTTSQLGSYYFDQFKPNNQVTGYVWAAERLSGYRVGGAIVNAIGIYKASSTRFERQITSRSPENIAEWLRNVYEVCKMIRTCERIGHWPMFTPSCTMYGKCEYHDVHVVGTEKERLRLLEQDYVRDEWKYEERPGVKDA